MLHRTGFERRRCFGAICAQNILYRRTSAAEVSASCGDCGIAIPTEKLAVTANSIAKTR